MRQDILVPFDGSADATEALRVAIDMAKAFKETIVLLNVQPSYETPHTKEFFSRTQINDFRVQMADEVMQMGKDMLKQSGVAFITKMRVGDPREQICQEAGADSPQGVTRKDRGVRFIVMGSRGLSAILGIVMGSVSMGVLHDACRPVMIVPHISSASGKDEYP
jgi:nucleotide-binding universal stress UspA family protein